MNDTNRSAAVGRRVVSEWSTERAEVNLQRVHARRARRTRSWQVAAAVAVAAVVVLAVTSLSMRRPVVARTPLAPSAAAVAPGSQKTLFADGSVALVSDAGELVVNAASAERIESVLRAGAADFEVTKRTERDFVVVAGAVKVRVVGTRFRVELLGERTRVSVAEGKVEVQEGDARSYLEAGESRFFPSAGAPAKVEPPAPPAQASSRSRFLELGRGGDYKAAYQLMSQSPTVVGSSAEELMLAADAARLSSHPQQALVYLRRVTAEHRGDSRAPLAAFTLGRLLLSQLGRPAEAADAFALSRRLRPGGSLAEDALAREAEARAASGGAASAAALAKQYLQRYPSGTHAPTMQRLITKP